MPVTDCQTPNGSLEALITRTSDGSDQTEDYQFSWKLQSEGVTTIGSNFSLSNKNIGTYKVDAISTITGCTLEFRDADISTAITLPPQPVLYDDPAAVDPLIPRIVVKPVTDCNNLASGQLAVDTRPIILGDDLSTVANEGHALAFDESDGYVAIDHFESGSNIITRTVETWVKMIANDNTHRYLLTYDANSFFRLAIMGGRVAFYHYTDGGQSDFKSNGKVNDGSWHHIAAVYDGGATKTSKIYIDGKLDIEGTIGTKMGGNNGKPGNITRYPLIGVNSEASTYNGNKQPSNGGYTYVDMDELRYWSTARTPGEILANMNKELSDVSDDDLIYYINFNQGKTATAASTITDVTQSGDNTAITQLIDLKTPTREIGLFNMALNNATENFVTGVDVRKTYNYNWYVGPQDNLNVDQLSTSSATSNNLEPGTYTVVAIDPDDNCRSTPLVITLAGPAGYPVPTFVLAADDTGCEGDGCVGGNGEFSAYGETSLSTLQIPDYAYEFIQVVHQDLRTFTLYLLMVLMIMSLCLILYLVVSLWNIG